MRTPPNHLTPPSFVRAQRLALIGQRALSLVLSPIIASLLTASLSAPCEATPGPDSVALIINQNSPDSEAIAARYIERRQIQPHLVCRLDLPEEDTVSQQIFYDQWVTPWLTCIGSRLHDLEAVVLTRGLPLRVQIDTSSDEGDAPSLTLSSASLLTLIRSTLYDESLLLPQNWETLARLRDCQGFGPCWEPLLENPWRSGPFDPEWFQIAQGVLWSPLWVTRLDGRSRADVLRLIDRSIESEGGGAGDGTFVLMRAANTPRGVRDGELEGLHQALMEEGLQSILIDYDSEWSTEEPLAGFITGSQMLGQVIEGNRFVPGALVDNLTSFGAHPDNFYLDRAEVQASVARWISQGVAGVHGATDEPLNFTFPSRGFLLDYVRGASLVEAYARHLPFLGWQNLVIGDPMTAPYMRRPTVTHHVDESGISTLTIDDPLQRRTERLMVFIDGERVVNTRDDQVILCSPEERQALAIAQVAPALLSDGETPPLTEDGFASGWAKGWSVLTLPPCGSEEPAEGGEEGRSVGEEGDGAREMVSEGGREQDSMMTQERGEPSSLSDSMNTREERAAPSGCDLGFKSPSAPLPLLSLMTICIALLLRARRRSEGHPV